MTYGRLIAAVGWLSVIAACDCGTKLPPPCDFSTPGESKLSVLALVGVPAVIRVDQPTQVCGLTPSAVSVHADVFDDRGEPVAVTLDPPSYLPSEGIARTALRLTPTRQGFARALVAFEPTLGRVQVDVVVALERTTDGGVVERLPVTPSLCAGLPWRTSRGAVVCGLSDGVHVYRAGVEEDHFAAQDVVVVGASIWSRDGAAVERRTDLGAGALRFDGQTGLFGSQGLGGSFATADALWLRDNQRVMEVRSTDAGMTTRSVASTSDTLGTQVVVDQGAVVVLEPCADPGVCFMVVGFDEEGEWEVDRAGSLRPDLVLRHRPFSSDAGVEHLNPAPFGWIISQGPGIIPGAWRPFLIGGADQTSLVPRRLPDSTWAFDAYRRRIAMAVLSDTIVFSFPDDPNAVLFAPR